MHDNHISSITFTWIYEKSSSVGGKFHEKKPSSWRKNLILATAASKPAWPGDQACDIIGLGIGTQQLDDCSWCWWLPGSLMVWSCTRLNFADPQVPQGVSLGQPFSPALPVSSSSRVLTNLAKQGTIQLTPLSHCQFSPSKSQSSTVFSILVNKIIQIPPKFPFSWL